MERSGTEPPGSLLSGTAAHLLVDFEILADSADVEAYDGSFAGSGEEELAVFLVVHEEILRKDGRAHCVPEDVERGLEVGISVGKVCANLVAGKMLLGGFVQAVGQPVVLRDESGPQNTISRTCRPFS